MTEAGWTSNNDAAETYAVKAAIEAVRHVLGAHKLTCDEHENLQQDFKDVAQEAYQQGRVAGLEEAARRADKIGNQSSSSHVRSVVGLIVMDLYEQLAQAAQEGGVGDE